MAMTKERIEDILENGSPRAKRRAEEWLRNAFRIQTLKRVLDPDDDNAVGLAGNEESYREELERRKLRLAEIEKTFEEN